MMSEKKTSGSRERRFLFTKLNLKKSCLLVICLFLFVVIANLSIGIVNLYPKFKNCPNVIELHCGMGNQMFMYAFGRALEEETGKKVCYDVSWFRNQKKYREKHEVFDAFSNFNIANAKKISYRPDIYYNKLAKKILILFYHKLKMKLGAPCDRSLMFSVKRHSRNILTLHNYPFNLYYFNKYNKEVFNDFTLKTPLDEKNKKMLEEIKKHKNSVSIHIRRGDYLKTGSVSRICTIDNYYNKALKIFEKMDDVHYFIFSNDIEWTKKNLKTGKPTTYVDINDEQHGYLDLELMKNCKHNIIANSTFSWWGAYLNQNPDKIVGAPQTYWEGPYGLPIQYPDDWKIIENIPLVTVIARSFS